MNTANNNLDILSELTFSFREKKREFGLVYLLTKKNIASICRSIDSSSSLVIKSNLNERV